MRLGRSTLLVILTVGLLLGRFGSICSSAHAVQVSGPSRGPGPGIADVLANQGASELAASTAHDLADGAAFTSYFPMVVHNLEARREPNDPYYRTQWALEQVEAPEAWSITTGEGVVIAIVDTGVQLDHPDLSDSLTKGWDFVDQDDVPADQHGHGTHVAGIAGATTNNDLGIAGMGWHVILMPVRVLDAEGNGDSWSVGQGIRYAADHGARIINLSLGGYSGNSELGDAVAYAQSKGALVVAAAGNGSTSASFYPAFYPEVLGVAATDIDDLSAWFSNYGSYVDISAPGESIISTLPGSSYGTKSGTSMATPLVSGLAALLWSQYPSATASEVAIMIMSGAEDLGSAGWDPYFGWGRINAIRSFHTISSAETTFPIDHMVTVPDRAAQTDVELPAADWVRGELIVRVEAALSNQQSREIFDVHGLAIHKVDVAAGLYLLRVPEGQEIAWAALLSQQANVIYAQPNYVLSVAE